MKKLALLVITAVSTAGLTPGAMCQEKSLEEISAEAETSLQDVTKTMKETTFINNNSNDTGIGYALSAVYKNQFELQNRKRKLEVAIPQLTENLAFRLSKARRMDGFSSWGDNLIIELSHNPNAENYPYYGGRAILDEVRDADQALKAAIQEKTIVESELAKTDEMIRALLDTISRQGK